MGRIFLGACLALVGLAALLVGIGYREAVADS